MSHFLKWQKLKAPNGKVLSFNPSLINTNILTLFISFSLFFPYISISLFIKLYTQKYITKVYKVVSLKKFQNFNFCVYI